MSSDESAWDSRRRASEDAFFEKANQEALQRLKKREESSDKPRLSPITGKPMEQLTLMGVVIDRCKDSGGVWLDAGELEQILAASKENSKHGWFESFVGALRGKK